MPTFTAGRSEDLAELARRLTDSFLGRCILRFVRMAGLDRCIVLSSQMFTALIPLLILVASLAPAGQEDVISEALVRKFGLTGDSAAAVTQLFSTPTGAATSGVSAFSALLVLFSGVSFTRRLQATYRAAWGQEKEGVRSGLFAALGLLALLLEFLVAYFIRTLVREFPLEWLWTVPISTATGLVLWTSIPYLLLNRQVHWRRLLAGGGLAAVATAVFGVATAGYMPGVVSKYTEEFGLFGITIAIIGWLLVAATIVVASTAIGAEFDATEGGWIGRLKVSFGLVDPGPGVSMWSRGDVSTGGLNDGDLRALVRVLVNWLILAAAVWAATALVPGIKVSGGVAAYLWLSLLLGLVNAVLGPAIRLLSVTLSWVTLGLSALVVNGVLLASTAGLSNKLDIAGVGTAVVGGLVIAVVTTLLEVVLRPASHPL